MPASGATPIPLRNRFWQKVNKDGPTHPQLGSKCWLWFGKLQPNGYGQTSWSNAEEHEGPKEIYAHRAAWILCLGPIPDGLLVCHKCDNRVCVNPDHLFTGTQKDNIADMDLKGRRVNSPAPKGTVLNSKISPEDAKLIKQLYDQIPTICVKKPGEVGKLAAQFGISKSQLWNIGTRRAWHDNT